jgi:hypothetical protein
MQTNSKVEASVRRLRAPDGSKILLASISSTTGVWTRRTSCDDRSNPSVLPATDDADPMRVRVRRGVPEFGVRCGSHLLDDRSLRMRWCGNPREGRLGGDARGHRYGFAGVGEFDRLRPRPLWCPVTLGASPEIRWRPTRATRLVPGARTDLTYTSNRRSP